MTMVPEMMEAGAMYDVLIEFMLRPIALGFAIGLCISMLFDVYYTIIGFFFE